MLYPIDIIALSQQLQRSAVRSQQNIPMASVLKVTIGWGGRGAEEEDFHAL
jgi:hypothetical protein